MKDKANNGQSPGEGGNSQTCSKLNFKNNEKTVKADWKIYW